MKLLLGSQKEIKAYSSVSVSRSLLLIIEEIKLALHIERRHIAKFESKEIEDDWPSRLALRILTFDFYSGFHEGAK